MSSNIKYDILTRRKGNISYFFSRKKWKIWEKDIRISNRILLVSKNHNNNVRIRESPIFEIEMIHEAFGFKYACGTSNSMKRFYFFFLFFFYIFYFLFCSHFSPSLHTLKRLLVVGLLH